MRFLEKLYFLFSAQILHFVFLSISIILPSQSFSPSSSEIKQSVCQFLQHIFILCTKKINLTNYSCSPLVLVSYLSLFRRRIYSLLLDRSSPSSCRHLSLRSQINSSAWLNIQQSSLRAYCILLFEFVLQCSFLLAWCICNNKINLILSLWIIHRILLLSIRAL